ncbi:hypothetical protein D3C76_1169540 [compost metagenome]
MEEDNYTCRRYIEVLILVQPFIAVQVTTASFKLFTNFFAKCIAHRLVVLQHIIKTQLFTCIKRKGVTCSCSHPVGSSIILVTLSNQSQHAVFVVRHHIGALKCIWTVGCCRSVFGRLLLESSYECIHFVFQHFVDCRFGFIASKSTHLWILNIYLSIFDVDFAQCQCFGFTIPTALYT